MAYDAEEVIRGLWQGAWPKPGRWLRDKGFTTLVLCAAEYQPPQVVPDSVQMLVGLRAPNPWPGVEVIYAPNDDNFIVPPSRETLRQALRAGRTVADHLAHGRKVLSTCWMGRNRSGLVSALAIHFHLGVSGERAAQIVQARRRGGLRNPVFCNLLSHLRRHDHTGEAVPAGPDAEMPNLERIPTLWTPQASLAFLSGRS